MALAEPLNSIRRNMLRLPARLEVQLLDMKGSTLRERDVLVAINLLAHGRYYYGNLVGLTDMSGCATIEGVEVEGRFIADRAAYPAEYKLDLNECDEAIELVILSAKAIDDARCAVAQQSGIPPYVRDCYDRARNDEVTPALLRIVGDSADGRN